MYTWYSLVFCNNELSLFYYCEYVKYSRLSRLLTNIKTIYLAFLIIYQDKWV